MRTGNKGANVTPTTFTPLADPNTTPWMMPYDKYSALMGLLANDGTAFVSPPWSGGLQLIRLRFSSPYLVDGLTWLNQYFHPHLLYNEEGGITTSGQNTSPSTMYTLSGLYLVEHLHTIWTESVEYGYYKLPPHFEDHFNFITLAFWIMRNGQVLTPNSLRISTRSLCHTDILRLVSILHTLLGDVKISTNSKGEIRINGFLKFRDKLIPHMYPGAMHRLVPSVTSRPTS